MNVEGVIDLTSMDKMTTDRQSKEMKVNQLTRADGTVTYDKAIDLRHKLIDDLAEIDEDMMELVANSESYDDITANTIRDSINKVTCANIAVPLLLGSALKNCGVQPLLNAIVDYLPSPEKSNSQFSLVDQVCAFSFKTIHQQERGAVTFLRLYNGSLKASSTIYNATQECADRIGKLYTILADQMMEIKSAQAGLCGGII